MAKARAPKIGKTPEDAKRMQEEEEAAELKAANELEDAYEAKYQRRQAREFENTIALDVAVKMAESNPSNGTAAGRWAADFIKEFRKRLAEPDTPDKTPTTDVSTGSDGEPASPEKPGDVL